MAANSKIKLPDKIIYKLSQLPENGMGYQIVDITLKNGIILRSRMVINSTYLKISEDEKITEKDISDVSLHFH